MILILLGALGVSLGAMLALMGMLFACTLPAARLIATWVEGKAYGFTVGGACFVGVLVLPWAVALINLFMKNGHPMPVVPVLAAVAIAYAFGEGIGRLACISFGCCYGKALKDCPPWMQKLFARRHFVFQGKNKKIAYASGLDCQKVIPIQALTATLYVVSGLVATGLFLTWHFRAALALALIVTQAWRAISEIFRSDYRGEQKISAYQIMSLLAIVYMLGVLIVASNADGSRIDLFKGLQILWRPGVILMLQGLWLAVFLYTGRSMVTASTISFHVNHDRV
jgi:prolipoprotein diacylglyceryltransferase